jgi:hypothetical protein
MDAAELAGKKKVGARVRAGALHRGEAGEEEDKADEVEEPERPGGAKVGGARGGGHRGRAVRPRARGGGGAGATARSARPWTGGAGRAAGRACRMDYVAARGGAWLRAWRRCGVAAARLCARLQDSGRPRSMILGAQQDESWLFTNECEWEWQGRERCGDTSTRTRERTRLT